jgi:hypothetical protein
MKYILLLVTILLCATISKAAIAYNNIGAIPPNVVSIGFEANAINEFGNYIILNPSEIPLENITSAILVLSSQETHSDFPTYPAEGFNHIIQINFYQPNTSSTPVSAGPLIYSASKAFTVPWKPENNGSCPAGRWYAPDGNCYSGIAFQAIFNFSSPASLPNPVIFGVAYNTQHYGTCPMGIHGPWDSLNLGLASNPPSVGENAVNGTVFLNSDNPATYNDGGAGGVGVFRMDSGWFPYTPFLELTRDCL